MTSKEIYEKYKTELVKKRQSGKFIEELGKEYGIPKGTLIKYFEQDGIIIIPNYKTKEYIDKVIELYNQGYHFYQIAEIVNSSHKVVKRTLIEQGIELRTPNQNHRKWELNEDYFDNIDTPNKAYILGFLFADGYNSLTRNFVRIALQEDDKDILEKMKNELGSNKPLKYLDFKGEIRSNGFTCKNMYQLEVYGKHITESLDKLGMHQGKSLILEYPNFLKENLHSHFIRGYFDGDGSISILEKENGKINSASITLTSTDSFCTNVYNILLNYINIDKFSIRDASCHNGVTRVLSTSNKKSCLDFCDWIYQDAEMYLERKYNKYLKLKNICQTNNK